jgi:orotate phosphoribosyltransferase
VRETVPLLRAAAKVELVALIVSVDRQERGQGEGSALAELGTEYNLQTLSIVSIDEIVEYLRHHDVGGQKLITPELDLAIREYRQKYGAT